MNIVYLVCAVVGGVTLVCQFVMTLVGLGGDHDVGGHDGGDLHVDHGGANHHHEATDHDAQTSWFVGLLTFRTIVAALTFFGLTGMAGLSNDMDPLLTLAMAAGAGGVAMFLVAWLMRGLHRLKAEGTVRIERAVGATGTVYLSIPGNNSGEGKVTVTLQNRTMEYEAVTPHDQLATGAKIVVTRVVGPGTVEVVPVTEPAISTSERSTHV